MINIAAFLLSLTDSGILLIEFVHHWKTHSFDEKMNAFFDSYVKSLIFGYKRFASFVGNSSALKMGFSVDKFLFFMKFFDEVMYEFV